MTHFARFVAGVALLAAVSGAAPQAAADVPRSEPPNPGLIGVRLLEAPVVRRDDPRARSYIVDHLKPGTTIKRRIEIANKSDERRTVTFYPSSAFIKQNKFRFAAGHKANELTRWTKIKPVKRTLDPYERSTIRAQIKVPDTASPGERYAVLWAQSSSPEQAGYSIRSISRVGVRVYLDVSDSGEYVDFAIRKLIAARGKDGRPWAKAQVHNTGKRAVDLTGKLKLSGGPGGLNAGPYQVTPGTTLPPGGTGTVSVRLPPRLPAGPWTAHMELDSGQVKREATAKLTFPRAGATEARLVNSGISGAWYAFGTVLAGGALMAFLVRRRRQRRI